MKLFYLTTMTGRKVAIPVEKITGVTEAHETFGNTFVATGADSADGGENGWYVAEKFLEVCAMLETLKGEI